MTPSKDKTTLSQKLHIRQIKVSMHEGQINQIILQALKLGKEKKKKKKRFNIFIAMQKLMPKSQTLVVFLQSLSNIMKPTNKFNELLVTEKLLDF